MKICSRCNQELSLEEFASRSSMCKPCHREYNKEHYRNNKQAYLDKARRNELKYTLQIREYVWNYLLTHPCLHCGETDPIVLEFDHIDPTLKSFNIAEGTSLKAVTLEVEKCQVLCANCHRRKTARQFDWWTTNASVYPRATNALKG